MIYVLDTDHLSILERGGSSSLPLQMRLEQVPADEVVTTIVTYEEQMRGWFARIAHARTVDALVDGYYRLEEHIATFANIRVLSFTPDAGRILESIHRSRAMIGTIDRRIAAIALANNATVLTRNTREFGVVPGLVVEDWSAG